MAEPLRKVPEVLAARRIDLLREQADVVLVREQLLEQ
jgi:hypothetical protein